MSAHPDGTRSGRRRSWAERQALAARLTARIAAREAELAGMLRDAMHHPGRVGLDLLLHPNELHPFVPGPLVHPAPATPEPQTGQAGHGLLGRLTRRRPPSTLVEREWARVQADQVAADHQRQLALAAARRAHTERARVLREQLREEHAGVRQLAARIASGAPDAVQDYFGRVLRCSPWPVGLPRAALALRYQRAARRLLVSWPLPPREVIPSAAAFRPDRGRRGVAAVSRSESDFRTRYTHLLAAIALRVARDLFAADHDRLLTGVVVNGELSRHNPMSGRDDRVPLVSLATERADFERTISTGDPVSWLETLDGVVSPDPEEPVRPLVDLPPRAEPPPAGGVTTDVARLSADAFAQLSRRLWVAAGLRGWTPRDTDAGQVVATGELPTGGGWDRCLVVVRRDHGPSPEHAVEPVVAAARELRADRAVLATTTWFPLATHRAASRDAPVLDLVEGDALRGMALRHLGIALTGVLPD